jgi:hypothetical protein
VPKRTPTDFDRWQLHRLKAFLEADSSRTVVDWTLIAELQACKDYLKEVGLGHLSVLLEEAEQLRVRGAVLRTPGTDDMPEGCLVCFAARDNKRKKA